MVVNINMLSNLALVSDNVAVLVRHGAGSTLVASLAACGNLPDGIKRDQTLTATVAGANLFFFFSYSTSSIDLYISSFVGNVNLLFIGLHRLSKDPDGASQVIKADALSACVTTAIQNPNNEPLAEAAMSLVYELAGYPAYISKIIDFGSEIITLVKTHLESEEILTTTAKALGLLAVDGGISIKSIMVDDGFSILVESLYANIVNAPQLLDVLGVLSKFATDNDAVGALLAAGSIDAVLRALKKWSDNAPVVEACITALYKMLKNDKVAALIGAKGGIFLLVKAMREHYKSQRLVEVDMSLMDSLTSVQTNVELVQLFVLSFVF